MNTYPELIDEIKELVPIYSEILNSGASPAAGVRFSSVIRTDDVPRDLLAFYRVANGCREDEIADIESMSFHPLEEIVKSKKLFDQILAEKQKAGEYFCWHTDWLPFADNGSYDTLVIDLTGKATGLKGCVLQRSKDSFEGDELCIVAPDFDTFIRGWADRVKQEQIYRADAETTDAEDWSEEYEDYQYEDYKYVKLTIDEKR